MSVPRSRRTRVRRTRSVVVLVSAGVLLASGLAGTTRAAATLPAAPRPATATETVLRPDGVVAPFTVVPAGSAAAAAVDDPVVQPAAVGAGDYLRASVAGRSTSLTLASTSLGGAKPAASQAWFYANTGAGTRLRVEVVAAGAALAAVTVPAGQGFGWRSVTFTAADQAAVDGLQLRVTGLDGGDANVRAAYVSLALTGRPAVVLRPDGEVAPFTVVPAGSAAAAAVDDPVVQPAAVGAGDYLRASVAGRSTSLTLASTSLGGAKPAASQAWFYANTGAGTRLRVEVVAAGAALAAVTVPAGQGFGWRSVTFTAADQAAVAGLQLRVTGLDGGDANVRAAYVSLATVSCAPAYGSFGPGVWPPGCWRPYDDQSVFNTPIPAGTVARADSPRVVDYLLHTIAHDPHPDWLTVPLDGTGGEPTYWSRPSDPLFTLHCTAFGPCSGDLEGKAIHIPAEAVPEGGPGVAPDADRHLTVVDQADGWEYDLWQVQTASPLPASGGVLTIGNAGKTRIDGDGLAAVGDGTAAQIGDLAGRTRAEELQQGELDHALFITVDCDSGTAVYPARKAGRPCSDLGLDNGRALPMGSWLQLAMTPAEIAAPTIPAWERPLLQAMATYGLYVGDTGSQGYFSVEKEAGDQYTSLGSPDPWLSWAHGNQGQAGWDFYSPDQTWVGHWTGVDWTKLRVLCRPEDASCPRT